MEFMGISVGILALICALVLLFGRHGTRKLLVSILGLLILGYVGWITIEFLQKAPNPAARPPQPAPAAGGQLPLEAPPAPLEEQRRRVGQIYQTPQGPMRWMGNGWQPIWNRTDR
jgi:hypothetical protein